jgi:hypothetical protein
MWGRQSCRRTGLQTGLSLRCRREGARLRGSVNRLTLPANEIRIEHPTLTPERSDRSASNAPTPQHHDRCKVALYNHGGGFQPSNGDPQPQPNICKQVCYCLGRQLLQSSQVIRVRRSLVTGLAAVVVMAAGAFAQQPPWSEQPPGPQRGGPPPGPYSGPGPNAGPNAGPGDDQGDAPDRGVARVSFMTGNVSVRRGDSGDLVAAVVNAPLTAGDRIVTAGDGRAEVQFDSANLIRIGPSSEVRLSELEYHRYQIQVAAGVTIFRVVRQTDAQVEISTPSVAMHPLQPGVYRVGVSPDGTSDITVRIGDAEVFSPRGSEPLHAGKTMMARGSASEPGFQLVSPVAQDDFEHWCISRDGLLASQAQRPSARYVNPDVAGAEDLDANGRWVNDGTNGNVWVPTVDPGWAPYSCGRWAWTDFYGWTWVGCESWGWAPYHYGRWYYGGYGWAWWPGPFVGRYYWHPALVGFFGWGAPGLGVGFGFGFGFGNIGWVPLGPGELFRPWYGRGFYGGGFRAGGVVGNVNVMSAFRNARFTNAVSSVRAGDFGHGAIGGANLVHAQGGELARAGMVRGQLPVAPSRESTQFSSRAASAQGLPHTGNTNFASHMAASNVNRVPFETQRSSMTRGVGGPGSSNGSSGFNGAGRPGGAGSVAPGGGASNGGWRSFDPSTRGGANGTNGAAGGGGLRPSSQPNGAGSNGAANNGSGRTSSDSGWRSYDGGNRGAGGTTGGTNVQPQNRPESQPRSYSSQPQNRSYSQPVRINPPIVQNRGNSASSGGSTGSGGNSRPSNSGSSHSGNAGHSGGGHGHK